MEVYSYKAITTNGTLVRGRFSCNNAVELDAWLHSKELQLLNYKRRYPWRLQIGKKLDTDQLATFLLQLSQLLAAGIPILQALHNLSESYAQTELGYEIDGLHHQLENGESLSKALLASNLHLPLYTIPMIEVGEKTGKLSDVLRELHAAIVWQQDVAKTFRKAISYPLFSGFVLLLVTVFLLTYLVPQLAAFILSTGQELPWYTQVLLSLSTLVRDYFWVFALALAGTTTLITLILKISANFRMHSSKLLIRLWLIGPVLLHLKVARFTYFSALMYQAGLTVIDAFNTCKQLVGNDALEHRIAELIEQIIAGAGIGESFERCEFFPLFVSRMLATGEQTGRLDASLQHVSNYFRIEAEKSIDNLQQWIGPFVLIIVGGFLTWVILAVIGPIYDVAIGLGDVQ